MKKDKQLEISSNLTDTKHVEHLLKHVFQLAIQPNRKQTRNERLYEKPT